MKKCELCKQMAAIYCESDQASLCWDCDAKVHSANFLVARHSRSLLCHVCRSATPWSATGPKLVSTFSLCEPCASTRAASAGEETDDDGDGEMEAENQVVPSPPPPESSSSSSDESTSSADLENDVVSGKRMRRDDSNGVLECCSSSPPDHFMEKLDSLKNGGVRRRHSHRLRRDPGRI